MFVSSACVDKTIFGGLKNFRFLKIFRFFLKVGFFFVFKKFCRHTRIIYTQLWIKTIIFKTFSHTENVHFKFKGHEKKFFKHRAEELTERKKRKRELGREWKKDSIINGLK